MELPRPVSILLYLQGTGRLSCCFEGRSFSSAARSEMSNFGFEVKGEEFAVL